MSHPVNRKFDLRVGDRIKARGPMSAWDGYNDYTYKYYIVTKIYKHIFIARTEQAENTVAERTFTKNDYICGLIYRA